MTLVHNKPRKANGNSLKAGTRVTVSVGPKTGVFDPNDLSQPLAPSYAYIDAAGRWVIDLPASLVNTWYEVIQPNSDTLYFIVPSAAATQQIPGETAGTLGYWVKDILTVQPPQLLPVVTIKGDQGPPGTGSGTVPNFTAPLVYNSGTSTVSATFGQVANTFAAGNDSRIVGAIQASTRGVASGVATLDGSTKVPVAQIPDLSASYIAVGQRAAASGVASLDSGTKVPVAQIPDLSGTYTTVAREGVANGVAQLGSDGKVPAGQLPAAGTGSFVPLTEKGAAGGVATLDGGGTVPTAQLPSLSGTYVAVSSKGAAGGVATLDGSSLIPTAQIPTLPYLGSGLAGVVNGIAQLDATGKVPSSQLPAGSSGNVPLSTVTTKGDIIVATASAAVTRLGSSAGVLTADGAGNLSWGPAPVTLNTITTKGDLLVGTGAGAVTRLASAVGVLTSDASGNLSWGPSAGSTAKLTSYDPSTSAGVGDANIQTIPAYNLQDALDWLNRAMLNGDQFARIEAQKESVRLFQAFAGALPSNTPDGTYLGFVPVNSSGRIDVTYLASGTPDGTKFLRDDGAFVAPTATVARSWPSEPGDQNLKAYVSDPNIFQNTAALLIASTCYAVKVYLKAQTYSNYVVHCQTIGATLAANLYAFSLANCDATGTTVAGSGTADAASVWTTTGMRTIAMGTPVVISTAGYYYVLVQMGTASTQPKVSTGAAHALANIGSAQGTNVAPNSALAPRWGTATTGFTGLTPPPACGNIIEGGSTITFFVGLS